MSDANFSSLIYRIIGKPERWHDDYIVEMMQQYLDEAEAVDDPFNLLELKAGAEILSRLNEGNVALTAFNTLLDKSRFQMIILDDQLLPIYHNANAAALYAHVVQEGSQLSLVDDLVEQITRAPTARPENKQNVLVALDYHDAQGEQVYLRSIRSPVGRAAQPAVFHLLMVLDKAHADLNLNAEIIAEYEFTKKEQRVLLQLIQGKGIREIGEALFVSENTVKSHLKSIYAKTGMNAQSAVISLILTHESQVLDSYFDSDLTTANSIDSQKYDRQMTLDDGTSIAYCDYGPRDGRPMLVFHSGFGSRLAVPPEHEEICARLNRRLIIPDRPGVGKTPMIEGYPDNWNLKLGKFIDALGIEEYDLLGSIIACQMAMSFAAQADQRLQRVVLTSPVFLNTREHTDYLTEILSPAARYVRQSPEFAREIYELWLKSVTLNLDEHYPAILANSIGSAELKLFAEHNIVQLLTDVLKEAARNGLEGILSDMVFCMTPLNLDLTQFSREVEIWYGTEDKRITEEGVRSIAAELPQHTLHVKEGYSEHIYYALFEDIIR